MGLLEQLLSHLWREGQEEEDQGPVRTRVHQEGRGGQGVHHQPLPGRLPPLPLGPLELLFQLLRPGDEEQEQEPGAGRRALGGRVPHQQGTPGELRGGGLPGGWGMDQLGQVRAGGREETRWRSPSGPGGHKEELYQV